MRRLFFAVLVAIAAIFAMVKCGVAQTAGDVSVITHYKVVPQVSTLEQSPRFLDIPTRLYRVSGNYDFARLSMPPTGAEFANSDVVVAQPSPTPTMASVVLDVDHIFNMDGLT